VGWRERFNRVLGHASRSVTGTPASRLVIALISGLSLHRVVPSPK
jgi:hypothetical protein